MKSTNEKLIAVIGATGQQGGGVVRALQASGQFKVRALSRNPGKHRELADEVVEADLDRPETLNAAFEGAHGVFLEVHPMLVFIALIIAGDLFGLLGLVLAIPVLGVLKVLLRFMDELYLRSDFYTAPWLAAALGEVTKVHRAAAATFSDVQNGADN